MKVRYYGHFGRTGYSRAAIETCMALARAGVTLEIRPIMSKANPGIENGVWLEGMPIEVSQALRTDNELTTPDVVIVHTLPGDCARLQGLAVGQAAHDAVEAKWIAYTTWEALTAPLALVESLHKAFDEIWVPSFANHPFANHHAFQRAALSSSVDLVRVRVLPHAFDEASLQGRRAPRGEVGVRPGDRPFRFYYAGAWNARKNPAGLIRSWAHAFAKTDHVELVLHTPGVTAQQVAIGIAQTGLGPDDLAPIRPVNRFVSDADMQALHGGMDCFVSAARGEAWNLPAFDAMLAGRHVITSLGLGSDHFLVDSSAELALGNPAPASVDVVVNQAHDGGRFDCTLVGAQGLDARSSWIEPDYIQIGRMMQRVAKHKARDLRVDYDPIERYGYEAVGKQALGYLEVINL